MKDIKLLFTLAKSSGSQVDVNNYTEAVTDALQNNPYQYASNIEYIISSSYGVKTFKEFVEKYGIPLISYNPIMESLNESIKQCSYRGINADIYNESKQLLESFKNKYQNAFIMFEAYEGDIDVSYDDYIKSYYNEYFNLNVPKVLSKFGEMAIPDTIITSIKNNKTDLIFTFLSEAVDSSDGQPVYYQWLLEASKDIKNPSKKLESLKKKFTKESLDGIVQSIKLRNVILHKESVLMGTEMYLEYSDEDIKNMKDYISFKEYYMTTLSDFDQIQSIQNDILSIYEEFDGIIPENESCADIVDMLPPTTIDKRVLSKQSMPGINESSNKKYGKVPDYLQKHHDLTYGENDDNKSDNEPGGDPISTSTKNNVDVVTPSVSNYLRNNTDDEDTNNNTDNKTLNNDSAGRVNNYYYTYNNSFNKHRTTKDDHSINNTDSSLTYTVTGAPNDIKKESVDMFSLNIFDEPEIMQESVLGAIATGLSIGITVTLVMPVVLLTGAIVTAITYCKIQDAKSKHLINKTLSEILNKKVKDPEQYILSANKHFNEFIGHNENSQILSLFYKSAKNEMSIPDDIKTYFGWANIKDNNSIDDLIFIGDVTTGIVEKSNIAKLKKVLEHLSTDDVKLTLTEMYNDLPGDDNGGLWSYFIDAGLIDKGPEDMNDDDDIDIMNDEVNKIISKYSVVNIEMIMQAKKFLTNNSVIKEAAEENNDPEKPESDHPIRDTLMDIDRNMTRKQQEVKKTVQDAINVGKTFIKPAQRTTGWISNVINQWKDKNENDIKEKMADPRSRQNLYRAIRQSIVTGSLFKAKLLFNPIFMFLTITKKVNNHKNYFRIRNEMIGEIKAELEIIDEKIKDADVNRDTDAKYKLMRIKNEVTKKLLRVDGGKKISRIL